MSKKRSIFAVFSVLISCLLLLAIWSNIHVYAQQQPPSSQSQAADSVTPELKAKMCDPANPSLKVVNATESRICGIPRTVKPHTAPATPPTSSVSSSAPQQTTTTTKPTSVASVSNPPPPHPSAKQQPITNTNANVTSQETEGSKIAPGTGLTNSLSLSSSSSPSNIAPQVKADNQQHQTPITRINGTAAAVNNTTTTGQNYTITSTTPTSDRIMYLGYPSYKSNSSNSPTHKIGSSPNLKPSSHSTIKSSHHIRSGTLDSRSTTTTKTSDLASSIKNKVDSIIRNTMKGLIHKTPFILPFH